MFQNFCDVDVVVESARVYRKLGESLGGVGGGPPISYGVAFHLRSSRSRRLFFLASLKKIIEPPLRMAASVAFGLPDLCDTHWRIMARHDD